MIANELVKMLTDTQKASARSNQNEVGPSEFGGCRRKVWYRLAGQEVTNPGTLRLASIMGTAIHTQIQEAFRRQDPFEERYLLEKEWKSPKHDLKGHVDLYDIEKREVVDWKTSSKKNLASYFPTKQQRWQIQLYGLLMSENGYPVDTVTLVGIARDGNESNIVQHSEPYDAAVAQEALAWLEDVKWHKEPPAPEKDFFFCKHYCVFFDETSKKGCAGRPKAEAEGVVIEDTDALSAVRAYLTVTKEIAELDKKKDSLKAMLEGVSGVTPDGVKVAWSEVAGRRTIDEVKVKELLGDVPMKYGTGFIKLTIKEG